MKPLNVFTPNYSFWHKATSYMFDRVLNTPITCNELRLLVKYLLAQMHSNLRQRLLKMFFSDSVVLNTST